MTSTGIQHVHLLVAEHGRAIAFYREVFGMEERFRGEHAPGVHYAYVADLDGYAIEI